MLTGKCFLVIVSGLISIFEIFCDHFIFMSVLVVLMFLEHISFTHFSGGQLFIFQTTGGPTSHSRLATQTLVPWHIMTGHFNLLFHQMTTHHKISY